MLLGAKSECVLKFYTQDALFTVIVLDLGSHWTDCKLNPATLHLSSVTLPSLSLYFPTCKVGQMTESGIGKYVTVSPLNIPVLKSPKEMKILTETRYSSERL